MYHFQKNFVFPHENKALDIAYYLSLHARQELKIFSWFFSKINTKVEPSEYLFSQHHSNNSITANIEWAQEKWRPVFHTIHTTKDCLTVCHSAAAC